MNWDDIRIFLAIAQNGSVRTAANKLNVNHSTISRRLNAFEESISVRLFERVANSYLLTSAGEDLLESALQMEEHVNKADRLIMGRDASMSGSIRITMPAIFASSFLLEELVKFSELYPEIDLEIDSSYELVNLNKRQADLAIRVTNNPPENLIGRCIAKNVKSAYLSRELWAKLSDKNNPTKPVWLAWDNSVMQTEYISRSIFPNAPLKHTISDPNNLYIAVKKGLGIAAIPCHIGDDDPTLMRLPPGDTEDIFGIWVLTHPDIRHTRRVVTFKQFIIKSILKYKDLLEGRLNTSSVT